MNNITPQKRYEKKYLQQYSLRFHINIDKDIINVLDQKKKNREMQGYIKNLIREDIKKEGEISKK